MNNDIECGRVLWNYIYFTSMYIISSPIQKARKFYNNNSDKNNMKTKSIFQIIDTVLHRKRIDRSLLYDAHIWF